MGNPNHTSSLGLPRSSSILLVLLTIMLSCSSSTAARSLGNETDRMALLDIKLQMTDPNGFLDSWNDSHYHCQWPGVSCDMRHRRVTTLTLRGKSLSGIISPYVGNLSFMKGIHLGENSLHGEIPQQFAQLSRLRIFNLSNNLLSGEIQVNFSICSKLEYINLERNQLIGEIPTEWGSLTKLENLGIGFNNLTGKIPASLGNLSSSLKRLSLAQNNLEGYIPTELGSLSRLILLGLGPNKLRGQIPSSLFNISTLEIFSAPSNFLSGKLSTNLGPKLRYIDLEINNLIGEIPAELGSLTKLETLGIMGNNLEGYIPAELGSLTKLEVLDIRDNNLEGYIPTELGSLSRLTYLSLAQNKLRGEIPSSLFNISSLVSLSVAQNFLSGKLSTNIGLNLLNLQFLYMGLNYFSGEIPLSISNCSKLEVLDLADNKFDGIVPPIVMHLQNLQRMNLEQNSLHGNVQDILEPLTNCTNLMILSLSSNKFSGELSNTMGNISSQIIQLHLGNNKISGTIPMELGNLVQLELLSLSNNSLTSVIPTNLEKLQNLEVLNLSENNLSGQIPITLCNNMTNLYALILSDNNLEGNLSHSIAKCQGLQVMDISRNKFSGSFSPRIFGSYMSPLTLDLSSNLLSGALPLELGKLANLHGLDVSYNKLSGHIPSTIGDCLVIVVLDMHNNHFSGSLPPSLASLKGIEHLDLSDNTLIGPIPGGMSELVYLKYLNLSYNNLEGKVPIGGVFSNASQIMLQGNTKLCGGIVELGLPACPVVHKKTKGKIHLKIILIPLVPTLLISTILFMYLFLYKMSDRVRIEMSPVPSEKMLRVSYHELYRATSEFSPANLIGLGSFGFVYKGSLVLKHKEIKVVAVKVLDLKKKGASKSFKAECKALSNVCHRNLVPLLTYCSSIDHRGDEFKALVYKYMENGSLDTWLHPDQPLEQPRCLNLLQRINVALDVALALDHLHNHSHIVVVHCDVKPSNILLDNGLSAYLGDFGIARLVPRLQQRDSSSTITIKGTVGYTAPEYGMGLEVSTQGDVYSYGIMLLEMFTGRRPTDDTFTEGLDLHNYVKAGLYSQVWKIVDHSLLSGEAPQVKTMLKAQECIIFALKLGIECSQGASKERMNMKQVIRELHFIRDAFCDG